METQGDRRAESERKRDVNQPPEEQDVLENR